jgi:PPOX class probable F420-dependent enzyme
VAVICRVTTQEGSGRAVHTRALCGSAEGRLYLRAKPSDEWARQLWERPLVEVAPCGLSGRPTGPPIAARGRILSSDEAERARRALRRRLWRRRADDELYVELVPA